MTTVHVVPTGDRLERHALADCPCGTRPKKIPRSDGSIEIVTLHKPIDAASAN